jgi:predicted acylesterase/phospholipase RssA
MEFNLPFSREESLSGGLQGRRLLSLIENRTIYLMAQVRRAINILLNGKRQPSLGRESFLQQASQSVTIDELERYAPQWASLMAPEPKVQAAVSHLLAQKYTFTYEAVPAIREALALDSDEVKRAYRAQYGKPLASLFAEAVALDAGAVDREKQQFLYIESLLSWLYLEKGETLFHEGDVGDSLYILMYGRLGVIIEQDDGSLKAVSEMGPGETFGEMALITGARRSATVMAIRDTTLFKLTKADFERLAERQPQVIMQIARIQAERVRRLSYKRPPRTSLITLAVIPISQEVPLADFCHHLVAAFASHGSTLHLNSQRLDDELPTAAAQTEFDAPENSTMVAWLSEQEMRYRFVIYQSDATPSAWTRRCIRQADHILLVGWADSEPALSEIELHMRNMSNARQSLVLLHPESCQQPVGTKKWLNVRQVQRHHHLRMREADFARLVRLLTGQAVCLVLGSGGARGFAHAGVVRAIEELGLEIDIVGGTSIGAMVGALVAMELDYERMYEFAKQMANPKQIFDYTLPMTSFLSGRKFTKILKRLYGEIDIEDLWRELFCITTNLTRAKQMVHQRGPLWKYVRASASLPLAFPPIIDQGDLLVDGAMVNLVPVDVMSELYQGGRIIGVDVTLEEDLNAEYDFGSSLSGWRILWRRLNPWQTEITAPSFPATLMRLMDLSSASRRAKQPDYAELYIRPPVQHFGTLDFAAYDDIIEIGYQSALPQLEAWLKGREGAW